VGSWIDVLCIFVLDLDPSNSRFGLRFKDLPSEVDGDASEIGNTSA
jgi:hypothetical protein